jgi:hypothetical protein
MIKLTVAFRNFVDEPKYCMCRITIAVRIESAQESVA